MKQTYMMTLATVAIALLSTPLVADEAASVSTDPAGTFYWSQDYGQGEADHWLVLYSDDDKLTGHYTSDGLEDPVKIENGKIKDGKFSFELTLEVDGVEVPVSGSGSVKGDKLTGTTEVELDGNVQEFDLEAMRKTRPEDVVGTWNLEIEAEGQIFEPVAVISQDGDKLKVEYMTDEFGDHEAIDVSLKDNKLAYTIAVESPEGALKLIFDTMPRGHEVAGTVEYEVGDITGSAEVEGEREVPVDLVGTWAFVVEAEGQVLEPSVKVTRGDDDKLKIELMTDEFGDFEAKDVKLDGDKLTFVIEADGPEGAMTLEFDCEVDGDEIEGEVEYEIGDISGTADFEGEKE